jgi:pyruvate/2-oxoglutarate dehydrogenase complex dihydrolipoamide acyltransferase (E2) component
MTFRAKLLCAVAVSGFAAFAATAPANALTTQECSAKYQAAKKDGTLGTMKWNDFRKAQCAADAAPAATPAAAPAAPAPAPAPTTAAKKETTPAAAPAAPAPVGNAVFPNAVDAKYAKETAGKGRMHTCLDQYNANKTNNGNGGLKWIEKGGGYYSECNKRLKGPA